METFNVGELICFTGDGNPVTARYDLNNENIVTVVPANYDNEQTLIIDPFITLTRVWATYFGGNNNDFIKATRIDLVTNKIYFVGHTQSIAFPPLWNNGTSYFTSNAGFAASQDAFIFRTSITGVREWCSYVFSTQVENCFSVTTDKFGNVFMVGGTTANTSSTLGFPLFNPGTPLAYFQGLNSCSAIPMYDGFITSFNPNGTLKWSTMFGSSVPCTKNTDVIYDIVCNSNNDILIVGFNENQIGGNFPFVNAGGYFNNVYPPLNNNNVGFIARFHNAAHPQNPFRLTWSTFLPSWWQNQVCVDASDNIFSVGRSVGPPYITFTPYSSTAYPNAYLHGPFGISANQDLDFDGTILAFNAGTQKLWWTYFGSGNGLIGNNGALDDILSCEISELDGRFYICGKTVVNSNTAPNNFPFLNAGYYNTSFPMVANIVTGEKMHGWIAGFNTNFSQRWGTYFPGNGQDEAVKLSVNKGGNILLCGNVTAPSNPTIPSFPLYNPNSPFYFDGTTTNDRTEPYIAMFNASNTHDILWSTYYGTNGTDEYSSDIEVNLQYVVWTGNAQNNIIKSAIPLAAEVPTSWQQTTASINGGVDGIIAKFNAPGYVRLAQTNGDIKQEDTDLNFLFNKQQGQITLIATSELASFSIKHALLIDCSGKTISDEKFNSRTAQLNIGNLASGIYLLKVTTTRSTKTFRFSILNR